MSFSGRGKRKIPQAAITEGEFLESILPVKSFAHLTTLGYHLKSGHTLSVQNRPTGLAEDVIVLPCGGEHLQGVD